MANYTVQSGDTLSGIARKLGVPMSSLSGFRSGNPNLIYPGENLSYGSPSAPTPAASVPAAVAQPSSYGSYQGIIDNMKTSGSSINDIYNPQIETLQGQIPDIQKRYADELARVTKRLQGQQAQATGGLKVAQAQNGNVQSDVITDPETGAQVRSTPEAGALYALEKGYNDQISDTTAQVKNAETDATNSIRTQIANIVAQQKAAQEDLNARIAAVQTQALQAEEQRRQFDEQMALERQKAASSSNSGLDIMGLLSAIQAMQGGGQEQQIDLPTALDQIGKTVKYDNGGVTFRVNGKPATREDVAGYLEYKGLGDYDTILGQLYSTYKSNTERTVDKAKNAKGFISPTNLFGLKG